MTTDSTPPRNPSDLPVMENYHRRGPPLNTTPSPAANLLPPPRSANDSSYTAPSPAANLLPPPRSATDSSYTAPSPAANLLPPPRSATDSSYTAPSPVANLSPPPRPATDASKTARSSEAKSPPPSHATDDSAAAPPSSAGKSPPPPSTAASVTVKTDGAGGQSSPAVSSSSLHRADAALSTWNLRRSKSDSSLPGVVPSASALPPTTAALSSRDVEAPRPVKSLVRTFEAIQERGKWQIETAGTKYERSTGFNASPTARAGTSSAYQERGKWQIETEGTNYERSTGFNASPTAREGTSSGEELTDLLRRMITNPSISSELSNSIGSALRDTVSDSRLKSELSNLCSNTLDSAMVEMIRKLSRCLESATSKPEAIMETAAASSSASSNPLSLSNESLKSLDEVVEHREAIRKTVGTMNRECAKAVYLLLKCVASFLAGAGFGSLLRVMGHITKGAACGSIIIGAFLVGVAIAIAACRTWEQYSRYSSMSDLINCEDYWAVRLRRDLDTERKPVLLGGSYYDSLTSVKIAELGSPIAGSYCILKWVIAIVALALVSVVIFILALLFVYEKLH